MNRHCLSIVLSIATFVVALIATASPAEAQLFRRWRAARQSAATPQYQQQQQRNQALQQQRAQQLQQQQRQSLSNRNRQPPQPAVPSANYPRTPQVVGPVRFPNQPASTSTLNSGTQIQSRTPTLAEPPKKVTDYLDSMEDGKSNPNQSSTGDEGMGQSILSGNAPKGDESTDANQTKTNEKDSARKESASPAAATMGLEVFQYSAPQNGVRIAKIKEDSQADESGIRVGDLIVAVDRIRTRSAEDVALILKQHQPGSSLRVQFVRDTISYVTNVPLIASNFSRDIAAAKRSPVPTKTGDDKTASKDRVTVAKPPTVAKQSPTNDIKLGMLIQDPESLRGTVVTKVRLGSIAEASGLKEGDRIVSVESKLLESGDRLREIMSELAWGDQLALGIVRDGELISRKVKLARTPAEKVSPEKKLAASKPKNNAQSNPMSGLGKGLGSMLGGFLSGGSKAKDLDADADSGSQVVKAGGAMPEPAEPADRSDDPLGFGDDEPIEQVIFQKKTDAR